MLSNKIKHTLFHLHLIKYININAEEYGVIVENKIRSLYFFLSKSNNKFNTNFQTQQTLEKKKTTFFFHI